MINAGEISVEENPNEHNKTETTFIGYLCGVNFNEKPKAIPTNAWITRPWVIDKTLKKLGHNIFIYAPGSVNLATGKVLGYYIHENEAILKIIDLPLVNYDFFVSSSDEPRTKYREFIAWAEDNHYKIYPNIVIHKIAGDKFESYEVIKKINDTIQPATEKFTNMNQIQDFFKKRDQIVLKPRYGNRGRNIITLVKKKHYYILTHYMGDEKREIYTNNFIRISDEIRKATRDIDYLIQVGIKGLRFEGSVFSFRVLMLEAINGWNFVPEIVCGTNYSSVSNFPIIDHPGLPVEDIFGKYLTKDVANTLVEKIKKTSFELIENLPAVFNGVTGELAFDFVVDEDHNIHLVEINTKPGMAGNSPESPDFFVLKEYEDLTQKHGQYLAEFLSKKHAEYNKK